MRQTSGHQHQNGTSAPRSDPSQEKRNLVSSTAQEAKEDLLAGNLELLSGHLEKAKRCHMHVTSINSSSSAPAQPMKTPAPQQAKQALEGSSLSQQQAAPTTEPQIPQTSAGASRCVAGINTDT